MKLLFVIDDLDSGGAQRQMVTLACGLKARRHEVELFTYYPNGHFKPQLDDAGIPVHLHPKTSRFAIGPVLGLRRVVRSGGFHAVMAFLQTPVFYAELVGLARREWRLVVGERLADPGLLAGWKRWLRWPHRFADAVVTNSHSNRLMLERTWPGLKPKLSTIYNAVDLERFRPLSSVPERSAARTLRMVVVANYQRKKNMLGLAKALHSFKQNGGALQVDWFGAMPSDLAPLNEARAFVSEHRLEDTLRFNPPTQTIEREYQRSDVVGLFSEYEGLPNVVCEAMACGKPIVMSDVCDARHLVDDGRTGFLCDPFDPESMAQSLGRIASLTSEARWEMGRGARRRAEDLFNPEKVLDDYERILGAEGQGKGNENR